MPRTSAWICATAFRLTTFPGMTPPTAPPGASIVKKPDGESLNDSPV